MTEIVYKVTVLKSGDGWLVKVRNAQTGATMVEWVRREADADAVIKSVLGVI